MKALDAPPARLTQPRLPALKPDTLVFALSLVFFLVSLLLAPVP
jgi:hypothetical protein